MFELGQIGLNPLNLIFSFIWEANSLKKNSKIVISLFYTILPLISDESAPSHIKFLKLESHLKQAIRVDL
jgi:hypothetical protein